MNHIMVAGHLGSDPEVRYTPNGTKVTTFRIAGNSRKGGKEETIWWRITVWGEQFDKMIAYFKKGSPIIVYGELAKPDIYTDKEGKPQVSLNVIAQNLSFSPFGRSDKGQENQAGYSQQGHAKPNSSESQYGNPNEMNYSYYDQPQSGQGEEVGSTAFSDEEIPF